MTSPFFFFFFFLWTCGKFLDRHMTFEHCVNQLSQNPPQI